jgi:hypothetical protein
MTRLNKILNLHSQLGVLTHHDDLCISLCLHREPVRFLVWKRVDNNYPDSQVTYEYSGRNLTTVSCGKMYTPKEILEIKKDLLNWIEEEL